MKSLFFFLLFTPFLLYGQEKKDSTYVQKYEVGDHELLLMPTAYTMEKGNSYFSDYELFILNYTVAPSNNTHISVLTLFPITTAFIESFTLGIKQNYYRSEKLQSAFWASYTPKASLLFVGNTVSFGKKSNSFHLGTGIVANFDFDDAWATLISLGYRHDFSRKVIFLAEYSTGGNKTDIKANGLISLGIRFRYESISWEIAGIRPLESTGDLLFFPLLKGTFLF